ncbi:MAG: beta-N-acetylhexosaminidase, partial [Candidatus Glassbacteria bacterium]
MKESRLVTVLLAVLLFSAGRSEAFLTELRQRGYSLIPAPQTVELQDGEVAVDGSWGLEALGQAKGDIAERWLADWAQKLHGLDLKGTGKGKFVLMVKPGTVKGTADPELNRQGYRLVVAPGRVEITGNDLPGLFYGVQSVVQLLKRNPDGSLTLPAGRIDDWPDLQLRFIHWDTKHHQKRPETLRRLLDWLALFKVNIIGFEMEDKYEYPRHPVIGAPGAYTKQEMQELTRYALERHIQIVPVIQSPAHFAYVLKHPEFAHLKADSASNYQACMCDEEAIRLIFDMYQDMIDATPGVEYFHVSTDEVYYAGICEKCQQKRPYNEQNRSQAWADFAIRAHQFLAERGRRMLAWVEYPLLNEHIAQLPPDLIDGVMGDDREELEAERKVGIRQLAYSSTQGSEYLFPNHFPTYDRSNRGGGRLYDLSQTVRRGLEAGANPIGSFAAAWDDSGLHEECFWLGWVTVTQYAWTCRQPAVEQNVADFMDVFYGRQGDDMQRVYELLIEGADFFSSGWDNVVSREREPGYGNSYGKGVGTTRRDQLLVPP